MMIEFVGDIHHGYLRKSNTPSFATARYDSYLEQKHKGTMRYLNNDQIRICMGDLFDRDRNPDHVLRDGVNTLNQYYDVCLSGNHDIPPRQGANSTFELLHGLTECSLVVPYEPYVLSTPEKFDGVNVHGDNLVEMYKDNLSLFFIPYCMTQEMFVSALELCSKVKSVGEKKILCLHTNYGSPFEVSEGTNNLTVGMAQKVLDSGFSYIVSGHEHNYREELDGKVIMTGSFMPVTKSDLMDKYVVQYDSETDTMNKVRVWEKSVHFAEYDVSEMPSELPEEIEFVSATGMIKPSQQSAYFKTVNDWWKNHYHLIAVFPSFEVDRVKVNVEVDEAVNPEPTSIIKVVEKKVKPQYRKQFKDLLEGE